MTQPDQAMNLETKIAGAQGVYDDFLHTFEAFKQANDARLEEIEKRMSADVVTEEKVDRINAHLAEQKQALDQLALKARRPHLAGPGEDRSAQAEEQKAAFEAYVRQGEAGPLRALEAKR